jgi:hypothetical protein
MDPPGTLCDPQTPRPISSQYHSACLRYDGQNNIIPCEICKKLGSSIQFCLFVRHIESKDHNSECHWFLKYLSFLFQIHLWQYVWKRHIKCLWKWLKHISSLTGLCPLTPTPGHCPGPSGGLGRSLHPCSMHRRLYRDISACGPMSQCSIKSNCHNSRNKPRSVHSRNTEYE